MQCPPKSDYSEHRRVRRALCRSGRGAMRKMANPYQKKMLAAFAIAAASLAAGCSSSSALPPDLTPNLAGALIAQKWSHDELNHFTVIFHSDTLIACGIQNELWKHVETEHEGLTVSTYQLTDAGKKALYAIDLKESGKYHEVILQGPYVVEPISMTPGTQPDLRQVTIRWDIDWAKAPAALKACLPRFELSGTQVALFRLAGQEWRFESFLKPDAHPAPQARKASDQRQG